jgi:hypothetical protein
VGLSVHPRIVARQRLGKNFPTAAKIVAGVVSYAVRVVSKESLWHPRIVARQRLGKNVPTAKKNCCRRRFLCSPCRMKESR